MTLQSIPDFIDKTKKNGQRCDWGTKGARKKAVGEVGDIEHLQLPFGLGERLLGAYPQLQDFVKDYTAVKVKKTVSSSML